MLRAVGVLGVVAVAAVAAIAGSARAQDGWQALYRPLHLPRVSPGSACPVSRVDSSVDWPRTHIFGRSGVGAGPVYPGLGLTAGVATASPDQQYGSLWDSGKVFWYALPSYRGPALLRGRRLDGPGRLGFDGQKVPEPELRIDGYSVRWSGQPARSRGIPSAVRVLAPGCYGVQIDGTSFSRTVVFRVVVRA